MDLGNWLRSLGLERYEAAFRENEIDETVLPELTQDHLREIGIPLGARIKLLKAIATSKNLIKRSIWQVVEQKRRSKVQSAVS